LAETVTVTGDPMTVGGYTPRTIVGGSVSWLTSEGLAADTERVVAPPTLSSVLLTSPLVSVHAVRLTSTYATAPSSAAVTPPDRIRFSIVVTLKTGAERRVVLSARRTTATSRKPGRVSRGFGDTSFEMDTVVERVTPSPGASARRCGGSGFAISIRSGDLPRNTLASERVQTGTPVEEGTTHSSA